MAISIQQLLQDMTFLASMVAQRSCFRLDGPAAWPCLVFVARWRTVQRERQEGISEPLVQIGTPV
jgi:hypothetical protein